MLQRRSHQNESNLDQSLGYINCSLVIIISVITHFDLYAMFFWRSQIDLAMQPILVLYIYTNSSVSYLNFIKLIILTLLCFWKHMWSVMYLALRCKLIKYAKKCLGFYGQLRSPIINIALLFDEFAPQNSVYHLLQILKES